MKRSGAYRPLLVLVLAPTLAAAADPYWGYEYRNVDVTASGTGAYTVNIARYCVRLDGLLTRILSIKSAYRPPTHVYALPAAQMKLYAGPDYTSVYRSSGYETTVILDSGTLPNQRPYWGAYFGYVATLLASDRLLGGPDWYMVGVPSVFADAVFEGAKAKIGNVTPALAYVLVTGGALIPMRSFLAMKQSDAEKQGKRVRDMFNAEAWYLAREVFVEGKRRAEFGKYLDLMRQGTDEPAAFAASFDVSYEQLDKELQLAMRDRAHVYIMDAPEDPGAARESAQPLRPAEVKARLALLSVRYQGGPDAVRLANEALQMEATNVTALRALSLAQLAKGAYPEALAAVDRLLAQGSSSGTSADSAFVLAGLSRAAAGGAAQLPLDAATLRKRAGEQYGLALAADAGDRRSRDGLAQLALAQ